MKKMTHHACFRFVGDDAHDGREAPAAQRARLRLIPQHGRALDAEPAVAALEQDGVGGAIHADDALIVSVCGHVGVALSNRTLAKWNMDIFASELVE